MGVTVGNKYHSVSGSYGMFFEIRKTIAGALDPEIGMLYSSLISCRSSKDFETFNQDMTELIDRKGVPDSLSDVLDFLFMPDAGGHIKHSTCNKIYNIIKNVDNKSIGYATYNQSLDDFKGILKECYSKRMNLKWY